MGDGARCGEHAGGIAHVVVVSHHHGQRNQRHGNDLPRHGPSDCAQNEADNDDRVADAPALGAKELAHGVQHVLGEAAFFKNRSHEREKRNGQQQVIVQY